MRVKIVEIVAESAWLAGSGEENPVIGEGVEHNGTRIVRTAAERWQSR